MDRFNDNLILIIFQNFLYLRYTEHVLFVNLLIDPYDMIFLDDINILCFLFVFHDFLFQGYFLSFLKLISLFSFIDLLMDSINTIDTIELFDGHNVAVINQDLEDLILNIHIFFVSFEDCLL